MRGRTEAKLSLAPKPSPRKKLAKRSSTEASGGGASAADDEDDDDEGDDDDDVDDDHHHRKSRGDKVDNVSMRSKKLVPEQNNDLGDLKNYGSKNASPRSTRTASLKNAQGTSGSSEHRVAEDNVSLRSKKVPSVNRDDLGDSKSIGNNDAFPSGHKSALDAPGEREEAGLGSEHITKREAMLDYNTEVKEKAQQRTASTSLDMKGVTV
ncbi:hypothetical protein EGW08_018773 [Elysia chlorotica]|uniref:Uncharacterized protein n=1 Tax=Elysia chlorotica TaxID=188477 RepID=A0A433SVY4_ELYCH|nr:hypothetical protein EGW08_018773 [Elysia chlorotica]